MARLFRIETKLAGADVDAQTGKFSGYGAVFGNVDAYGDVIASGAFRTSLKEWQAKGKYPPMLLQHDAGGFLSNNSDGIPVGVWTHMEEDGTGLKVEGRLINLDTDLGKRVYGAMREGVLDGLSIGYRAKKFAMRTKPDEPRRLLEELDLLEVSIVTMPANTRARLKDVKSDLSAVEVRDLEAALRDEGLSHKVAATAISGFKKWLRRDGDSLTDDQPRDEEDLSELVTLMRRNLAKMK
jgi:HK97 family phage prohead protease